MLKGNMFSLACLLAWRDAGAPGLAAPLPGCERPADAPAPAADPAPPPVDVHVSTRNQRHGHRLIRTHQRLAAQLSSQETQRINEEDQRCEE